jgi:predicted transposase/invertase (TIGR01784 family)
MIIANPIYDVVFKRLMENEKVAKFFISTLTDCEIEHIQVRPQEFTYTKELTGLSIFRLDFVATIKTEQGNQKVLIEVQKAFDDIDIMRFRNYLGEQYKKQDIVNGEETILPITTIYILGFNIPEIPSACAKIAREYFDLIERKLLTTKSDFVEKLTHDCYIVQVQRISSRIQTKLDKLLSLFEQSNFIDEENKTLKNYPYNTDVEELKIATDILHHASADPEQRKLIEIEQEAWRSINALFQNKEREWKIELSKEKLEKEQERQRAEREKQRAEQEHKKLLETAKLLLSLGVSIEIIKEKTGLTQEEIEKL